MAAVRKAIGPRIPYDCRPVLAELIKTRGLSIKLKYDWIKDTRFISWAFEHEGIDFADGSNSIEVWVVTSLD